MPIKHLTVPGRIVWGHPMRKQIKTDPKTRKPILDKEGKEQDVWSFGLAIPNSQFAATEQAIAQVAYQQYPQGNFPRDFAWKIKRETDLDESNKPYSEREGYAGHTVINISTQAFCPPVYKFEGNGYRQLTEQELKTGDWACVELMINSHTGGVYLNPSAIELVGYDKEIVSRSATNPNEAFGGRTYALPPGVSTTPVAGGHAVAMPQGQPQGYQPPAQPQYAAPQPQGYQPPAQPQPQYSAQPSYAGQPQAMPQPAHDVVRNAAGYQPPAQPQLQYAAPQQPQGYQPPAQPQYAAPQPQPAAYQPPAQPQPQPQGYQPPPAQYAQPGVPTGR